MKYEEHTNREIERQYDRPGVPPTSIWAAVSMNGMSLVLLIGIAEGVDPLMDKLLCQRNFPELPIATVYAKSRGHIVPITLLFVGRWPSLDEAKKVVKFIAGEPGDTSKQWEQRLVKLVGEQPECVVPATFRLDDADAYELCDMYIAECRRVMAS